MIRARQHFVIFVLVSIIIGPFVWWATDRTPPFIRVRGELEPKVAVRGSAVRVRYHITKRIRPEESCPGVVQQEIVDGQDTTFSKLGRPTGPVSYEPDPEDPTLEIFVGRDVIIPEQAAPGLSSFRTVTFRYCNWLQRWLQWPIVQIGPDIPFEIIIEPWDGRSPP